MVLMFRDWCSERPLPPPPAAVASKLTDVYCLSKAPLEECFRRRSVTLRGCCDDVCSSSGIQSTSGLSPTWIAGAVAVTAAVSLILGPSHSSLFFSLKKKKNCARSVRWEKNSVRNREIHTAKLTSNETLISSDTTLRRAFFFAHLGKMRRKNTHIGSRRRRRRRRVKNGHSWRVRKRRELVSNG